MPQSTAAIAPWLMHPGGWQPLRAGTVALLLLTYLASAVQLPATRTPPQTFVGGSSRARRRGPPTRKATLTFAPSFKAAYRARGSAPLTGSDGPLLHEYVVSELTPRHELTAMLHGLGSSGQLETALQLVQLALEVDAGADEGMASIVLNRCAELGRMDLCDELIHSLSDQSVPLSGLTYCILIKGHGRAGDVRLVSQTYTQMRKLHVAIDLPTFNALVGLRSPPEPHARSAVPPCRSNASPHAP